MATASRRRLSFVAVLALGACIVPSRPPPAIDHVHYPLGAISPRRHGAKGLFVGAASVDVTPPEGGDVWLAGYGFQRRMARVNDPISARAVYFDDGTRRVAVVVADVVGLFITSTDRIRRLVGNDIEVVVVATHNHQSPDTMGYWGPALLYAIPVRTGLDPAYLEVFERRLALAVKRAAEVARPAQLYVARAELAEGLVRNLRAPGVYDRAIEIVEARSRVRGDVITTFVNFGCHPETLGDRARLLSADFPGVLRRVVEAERGGVAVFANGALGGMITPGVEDGAELGERLAFVEHLGTTSGRAVLDALAGARPVDADVVDYHAERVHLPVDNDLFRYITRVGLVEPRPIAEDGSYETEVGLLRLGPLAWAFVPGEPTPAVAARLEERMTQSGIEAPVIVALGNDELGYLLTPDQFDDAAYGYEASVSPGRSAAVAVEDALDRCLEPVPVR